MPQVDSCPLCRRANEACMFHSAGSPKVLLSVLGDAMRKRGADAWADFLVASITKTLDELPDAVLDVVCELDERGLYKRFGKLVQKESFSSDELRTLAGQALALATIMDAREDPLEPVDDEGDDDGDEDEVIYR